MQQALCGSLGRGLSQPNGGGILGPAAPMGEGSHDQPQVRRKKRAACMLSDARDTVGAFAAVVRCDDGANPSIHHTHACMQTVMGMDDGMHGGGGGGFPISGISAFLQGHHPSVHLVKTEGAGGGASALQHLNQQPRHVSAGEGPTEGETAPACSGSDAGQASGFGGGSAGAGFTQAPHMRFFKKVRGRKTALAESASVLAVAESFESAWQGTKPDDAHV